MKRGPDRVATFYEQVSENTAYVRCRLPARHLPGLSMPFEWFDETGQRHWAMSMDDQDTVTFPKHEGAVSIWQYPGSQERALPLAAMQTELGVKVLIEVDDNYLVSFPGARALETDWVDRWYDDQNKNSHDAHKRICEFADGVIVSTPWLAGPYGQVNDNVFVCPNAVDPADWPEPDPYQGVLRVGWHASYSHIHDAPLVRRALLWASKQPRTQVHLFGNMFVDLKKRGQWKFRSTVAPWTHDHQQFRQSLGVLDVALCPLRDNEYARGKSPIKAWEAAMSGALPIVSRAEAYRDCWDTDFPCLVAETAGGFEEAVRWCVQNRDEVQRLAAECREYVLREHSFPLAVMPWREAVAAVAPKPELVLA